MEGIERPPLNKLWPIQDNWGIDAVKSLLDQTLVQIDCTNITSKLFREMKINQIDIRCIRVNNRDKPHLLIDNLSRHISETLDGLIERISSSNLLVLLGTSGCGKTRTIFEYLSNHYGFYFTVKGSRVDQYIPGSSDFQYFLERTQNRLKDHPLSNPENTTDDNQRYVGRFVQCIFVARLYLFEYLFKKIGKSLTPELWLYIQLFPERIFVDCLFSDLVGILRHLGQSELNQMLLELIEAYPAPKLACFLVSTLQNFQLKCRTRLN